MAKGLNADSSPYLRERSDDLVEWRGWDQTSLDEAKETERPILLHIGYFSNHICKTMAQESFRDEETAAIINNDLIPIAIDRELRPDLERRFKVFVQATTGLGGWPLNIFLTPEGLPYLGGGYFPTEPTRKIPSFKQVLDSAKGKFSDKSKDHTIPYKQLRKRLKRLVIPRAGVSISPEIMTKAYQELKEGLDPVNGGLIGSPKFPQHPFIELLLRLSKRFRDPQPYNHACLTLSKITSGGIYDQLEGGLHRSSIDAFWRNPQYEKMLYDQAQFIIDLCILYKASVDEDLLHYISKTAAFILQHLSIKDGFASSRSSDAESGCPGYYTWSEAELRDALSPEDFKFAALYFDIAPDDAIGGGPSVVSLPFDDETVMEQSRKNREEFERARSSVLSVLLRSRKTRPIPPLDTKLITSWNAITATALLQAKEVTGNETYSGPALNILDKLVSLLQTGTIPRTLDSQAPGFLEDHVFTAEALFQGFLSTGDETYLSTARDVIDIIIEKYYVKDRGTLKYCDDDEELEDDPYDHDLPSATSQFVKLLLKVFAIIPNEEHLNIAHDILVSHHKIWSRPSPGASNLLNAFDMYLGPVRVAVVSPGPNQADMTRAARSFFDPNLLVLEMKDDMTLDIIMNKPPVEGKSAVYLCQGKIYKGPETDPEKVEELLLSL